MAISAAYRTSTSITFLVIFVSTICASNHPRPQLKPCSPQLQRAGCSYLCNNQPKLPKGLDASRMTFIGSKIRNIASQHRVRSLFKLHRRPYRLAFSATAVPGVATSMQEHAGDRLVGRSAKSSNQSVDEPNLSCLASSKASLSLETEQMHAVLLRDRSERGSTKSPSVEECISEVSVTSGRSDRQSDQSRDESLSAHATTNVTRRGGKRLRAGRKSNREPVYGLSTTRCIVANCTTYASYGDPIERLKLFCSEHRHPGTIDLKNRICMFPEGCSSRATYGSVGNSSMHAGDDHRAMHLESWFCASHRGPSDFKLFRRLCEAQNCKKIPAFGDPRSGSPRFCREHKLAFHVDVKNKKHPTEGSYVAR
eukprot:763241-Hanusia_phi.AAC.3